MFRLATVEQLIFDEQFGHLEELSVARAWCLIESPGPVFTLMLTARDKSHYWLKVECDDFPELPPAWHWFSPESGSVDIPDVTPTGKGGYFHSSGRICAPWNRLAYKQIASNAPHGDWELSGWQTNPRTMGCTTFSAMALRLQIELQSERYVGRTG